MMSQISALFLTTAATIANNSDILNCTFLEALYFLTSRKLMMLAYREKFVAKIVPSWKNANLEKTGTFYK